MTRSPRRGPGRDVDLELVGARARRPRPRPAASRRRRGGPCPWPGGPWAPCAPTRARARACAGGPTVGLLLLGEAGLLLLEPARVVALERDAPAPVELEDPAGHVVEEVAVVGDGDDRAGVVAAGSARATPPTRRRGGWWARRAAAGRAATAAAGTARPGGARRRTASSTSASPGGQAQGVHGDLDGALEVPGAGGLDLRLEVGLLGAELLVVGVGVGPAGQHLVVLGRAAPATSADAVHDVAVHVLGRVELRLLLEQADGEAGREAGLAGVAVVDAGHDRAAATTCRRRWRRARRSWRPGRTTG